MSTRTYPLYRLGNPQLRVFLPNFWMKLVNRSQADSPPNHVTFVVSSEMTRLDVKNYLEKIYQVPVMNVRTINCTGATHQHPKYGFIYKDDDFKVAYVKLPKDYNFDFPDVVKAGEQEEKRQKSLDEVKDAEKVFQQATQSHKQPGRRGLPTFFGL